jgi:acyl dehydratase
MTTIHLEDLAPGQAYPLGGRTFSRDEIVGFARAWDPQPFHLDEAAVETAICGGLIASGWHTVCAFIHLLADGLLERAAALGPPAVDELRWLRPVRPGDTLDARIEILEVGPSGSRRDRGTVRARCVMTDQDDNEVLTMNAVLLLRRRPARDAARA